MLAIVVLFGAITVSILMTRVATIALTHTGLSREVARFQARSAITGVGFTTSESEKIMSHPVRLRILMILMLLGNVGIVTVVSTFIITFVDADNSVMVAPRGHSCGRTGSSSDRRPPLSNTSACLLSRKRSWRKHLRGRKALRLPRRVCESVGRRALGWFRHVWLATGVLI